MKPKALSREIKFRAWDEENKKFIRSSHCIEFDGSVHMYKMGCVIALGDKVELNQWTGLHDKNGKEIYEGDIVLDVWGKKQKVEIGEIYHASYEDTFAGYGFGFDTHSLDDFKETVEIIGNIYETPELLN